VKSSRFRSAPIQPALSFWIKDDWNGTVPLAYCRPYWLTLVENEEGKNGHFLVRSKVLEYRYVFPHKGAIVPVAA
jgi:hypothetical protein